MGRMNELKQKLIENIEEYEKELRETKAKAETATTETEEAKKIKEKIKEAEQKLKNDKEYWKFKEEIERIDTEKEGIYKRIDELGTEIIARVGILAKKKEIEIGWIYLPRDRYVYGYKYDGVVAKKGVRIVTLQISLRNQKSFGKLFADFMGDAIKSEEVKKEALKSYVYFLMEKDEELKEKIKEYKEYVLKARELRDEKSKLMEWTKYKEQYVELLKEEYEIEQRKREMELKKAEESKEETENKLKQAELLKQIIRTGRGKIVKGEWGRGHRNYGNWDILRESGGFEIIEKELEDNAILLI